MKLLKYIKEKLPNNKKEALLSPEDTKVLKELERKAYMEEAKILVVEKGKNDARKKLKVPTGGFE